MQFQRPNVVDVVKQNKVRHLWSGLRPHVKTPGSFSRGEGDISTADHI